MKYAFRMAIFVDLKSSFNKVDLDAYVLYVIK